MSRYWQRIEPDPALADTYNLLLDAARDFRARGLASKAIAVLDVIDFMEAEYKKLSADAAREASAAIKRNLASTQKRPDRPGGPHLRDFVKSDPLQLTAFPAGEVGIGDLDELDRSGAARMGRTGTPYWRAIEHGSTAAVGRIVPGFFMPGRVAPDPAQFRVHPYFEQAGRGSNGKARKGTPAMRITRAIQPQRFMEKGTADVARFHQRESQIIVRQVLSKLAAI